MKQRNIFGKLLQTFLLVLIPTLLIFFAKSTTILDTWIDSGFLVLKKITINQLKDYLLLLGILINFFLVAFRLTMSKIKQDKLSLQKIDIMKLAKNMFVETMKIRFRRKNKIYIDIRIVVPIKVLFQNIRCRILPERKREFIVRNIDYLGNTGLVKDLCFRVYPNPQGLVGKCYETQKYQYDDNLIKNNNIKYNLNEHQIAKIGDLRFSFCCPIVSKNEDVIGIVAYDTYSALRMPNNITQQKQIINEFKLFTQTLYENLPELFKPYRSI